MIRGLIQGSCDLTVRSDPLIEYEYVLVSVWHRRHAGAELAIRTDTMASPLSPLKTRINLRLCKESRATVPSLELVAKTPSFKLTQIEVTHEVCGRIRHLIAQSVPLPDQTRMYPALSADINRSSRGLSANAVTVASWPWRNARGLADLI